MNRFQLNVLPSAIVFSFSFSPSVGSATGGPGVSYEDDFIELDGTIWMLAGSAHHDAITESVVLTDPVDRQVGGLFNLNPIELDDLEVTFVAQIGGGDGADGIAMFVVAGEEPPELGGRGSSLGIAGMPPPIFHVELDTYGHGDGNDLEVGNFWAANHIGVGYSGTGYAVDTSPITQPDGSVIFDPADSDFRDSGPITVLVQLDDGHVTISIQNDLWMPDMTKIIDVDLEGWRGPFRGILGFAAATGGGNDRHEIHYVKIGKMDKSSDSGPSASLWITPPAEAFSCRARIPVYLRSTDEVRGFSFGISFDGSAAFLEEVLEGAALKPSPAFFHADEAPRPCDDGRSGATLAAVLSLEPPLRTLPAGIEHEIAALTFRARRPGSVPIDFVDCLGDPPVDLVVTTPAGSVEPDTHGAILRFSGVCFVRGDAVADGKLDISDPIKVLYYLFAGEAIPCLAAADGNGDGAIDLGDAVYLLAYLFQGGHEPPAPFPVCGGESAVQLPCDSYAPCEPEPVSLRSPCPQRNAFLEVGYAHALRDNEEGTVSDLSTGLMWQNSDLPGPMSLEEAVRYCESLQLGGHADWRLPNIKELLTLVRYDRTEPAADPIWSWDPGPFWRTDGVRGYWSNTAYSNDNRIMWCVNFGAGATPLVRLPEEDLQLVRAVRGPISAAADVACEDVGAFLVVGYDHELVDSGDGTVSDLSTGLMWQKSDAGAMSFEEAITYCENLQLGGAADWRFPNIKELFTLVRFDRDNPAAASIWRWGAGVRRFWSSTERASIKGSAWRIHFNGGVPSTHPKSYTFHIRAVRSIAP